MNFKASNAKSLLVALIFNNSTLSLRRILQLYGMKLALDHVGMRELRTMFGACNKRSWYRLMADMRDVNTSSPSNPLSSFQVIRDCLEAFKTIEKTIFGAKKD